VGNSRFPRAEKPPNCGELGVFESREIAQVWGIRGSREWRNRPSVGILGFPSLDQWRNHQNLGSPLWSSVETGPKYKRWKLGVFQADRERIHRPSVWGNSRFSGRSREKLPKCGESGFSMSIRVMNTSHV
jgi:hypothetical protein